VKRKTLEEEINEFLEIWEGDSLAAFLNDVIPLIELYYTEVEGDWVVQAVGEEEAQTVRLIRTVYLLSRIAEIHAPKLATTKVHFKNLFHKMERQGIAKGE
jgi:hypothetical protein